MAPPLWCECATGFTAVKVWCSPSSPCSLRCAWLRVVPLLPSPTLHAVASVSPGRDGEADPPIEPRSRVGDVNDGKAVALWVECDDSDRCPVAGLPTPALRIALTGSLIDCVPLRKQRSIVPSMTLSRCDIADPAMPVLMIVPVHEATGPLPRGSEICEPLLRVDRPILRGAEQRLHEGVVVAHSRTRVRRHDAEPMQHGQHFRGLERRAIVTMQHRSRWQRVNALSERRTSGQMRSMLGGIRVMHLETHDLAAIQVEDQIQVEPTSLHLRRKERHIPAPDLAGASGNMGARRP